MPRSYALAFVPLLMLVAACGASPEPAGLERQRQALSAGVVVSQIYGGGGNSSAAFNNDFVELHNNGAQVVSVAGWSVQYASAAGSTFSAVPLPDASIPAGGYFLIQLAAGGAMDASVLPTPDFTWSTNLASSAGKVALLNTAATLVPDGGPCSYLFDPNVVDFVGYGSTASCFETAVAPGTSGNTSSTTRKKSGCQETDSNGSDFELVAANPRNSGAALVVCSADAGAIDAGAVDAGAVDSGVPDAGAVDAGVLDAGTADAGSVDAGGLDAGLPDAGAPDAGGPGDSGVADAGVKVDAGVDAGRPPDAGVLDAGRVDSGVVDAGLGAEDSGVPPPEEPPPFDPSIIPKTDAGTGGNNSGNRGCGCDASSTLTALAALALPMLRGRRRRGR